MYATGWFIKKGKNEMVDDRRRRWMELLGPKQVINYYTGVDAKVPHPPPLHNP